MTRTNQRGFTLIELVVVITILGILAAFAVPKFLSLDKQARLAAISALQGSLRSSASLAHSMFLVSPAATPIVMDGTTITMVNGYPDAIAAGIGGTLQDSSGFTAAGTGPYIYTLQTNCTVSYAAATATVGPVITSVTTGC